MKIEKMPIKFNKTPLKNRRIRYIVIHDTGNAGKGAGVDSHFKYFNGGDRQSSADFFVDDKKIGQFTDYKNEYSWHAGKKYGKPPITDCTNANSVGIEICVNMDGNYAQAVDKTVELVKHLQAELNIPNERVIRHYDACLKQCPGSMSANNWAKWHQFKARLAVVSPLKQAYGFNDDTIAYIRSFKHAEALEQALLTKKQLAPETRAFLLKYKFGQAILNRVYNIE